MSKETKKINFVNKDVTIENALSYVKFVVENSFDEEGNYHEYLYDYAHTVAILHMFTDYDGSYKFFDIAKIVVSGDVIDIEDELVGNIAYDFFCMYTKNEVKEERDRHTTLGYMSKLLKSAKNVVDAINNIVSELSAEDVKKIDFASLFSGMQQNNMEDN